MAEGRDRAAGRRSTRACLTKPSAQRQFLRISHLIGRLDTHQKKRAYVNFYGNLMKLMDAYVVDVLDALEAQNLLDNTLVIRTSDHGEMGLAHGGLRQKCFNVYEETMRIPLVYSNPRLWSKAADLTGDGLACRPPAHAGQPGQRAGLGPCQVARRRLLRSHPPATRAAAAGLRRLHLRRLPGGADQPTVRQTAAAHHQRARATLEDRRVLRRQRKVPSQWEMYDLKRDPLERTNLAHKGHKRTPAQEKQYQRLHRKLARVKHHRLHRLPDTPQPQTMGNPKRTSPISSMD